MGDITKGLNKHGIAALTKCADALRTEAQGRFETGGSLGQYELRLLEVLIEHVPPRAPTSARCYVDEDDLPQVLRVVVRLMHSMAPYLDAIGALPPAVVARLISAEGMVAEDKREQSLIRMVRARDWEGVLRLAREEQATIDGRDLVRENAQAERVDAAPGPYSSVEQLVIRMVRMAVDEGKAKSKPRRRRKEAA